MSMSRYRVRGTVRSTDNLSRYKHITSLPHASSRLELVKLDLLDDKESTSWARAFDGEVSGRYLILSLGL
jgi:hypothetical protein